MVSSGQQGGRDGNGLIDGCTGTVKLVQAAGETALFWSDLSTAKFIDDSALPAPPVSNNVGFAIACGSCPGNPYFPAAYLPPAKIGYGNYVYVYETGGYNWFGITDVTAGSGCTMTSGTGISVSQAYNIDKKIDDGLPTSGSVQAVYINGSQTAISTVNAQSSDSATSCYNSTTNTYSTDISNGSGPNCALSFKMQGTAR